MSAAPVKCVLKPGEQCLYCGHVGPKKQPKEKPCCEGCKKPFTRDSRWRLLRGKRWHVRCVPGYVSPLADTSPAPLAPAPTAPPAAVPEFSCENCTWDGADNTLALARRCKRCAGKLGFSLRVKKRQTNP